MRNLGLLCGALAIGLLHAQTTGAPARLVARALGETPLFDDLQELCDGIGGRPTGSPAEARAIEWAAAKFRAAGLSTTLESYKIPDLWLPIAAHAEAIAPQSFSIRLAAAPFTASTKGTIEAPLVDAGDGTGRRLRPPSARAPAAPSCWSTAAR